MEPNIEAIASALADLDGPVCTAVCEVNQLVRILPMGPDFHYYNNFPAFKERVHRIKQRAIELCQNFAAMNFPEDMEETRDWLVNAQDDVFEKVDSALDAIRAERKMKPNGSAGDVLQRNEFLEDAEFMGDDTKPKKAYEKDKSQKGNRVNFHLAAIARPQDVFDWSIDNSTSAFIPPKPTLDVEFPGMKSSEKQKKSEAADVENPLRLNHPLEDFISKFEHQLFQFEIPNPIDPIMSLEKTPFHFVDDLAQLKRLSTKLRSVSEFAVDLEHHHFRSFQGFTCLIQISTRDEDFVIDPFPIRASLGPVLGPIFANPCIVKVFHGSDKDIVWLQRDFGIYVVNLFDTGQAARVLELESCSLAFLLLHFCSFQADKRYQLADWRMRPLPQEMLNYARNDTHYLLFIYDQLRSQLFTTGGKTNTLITEVLERSKRLCLQVYEKPICNDRSCAKLLLSKKKSFSQVQQHVFKELYQWRDRIAREKDESTGYVLSNNALFKLAEVIPDTFESLKALVQNFSTFAAKCAAEIFAVLLSAKSEALKQAAEVISSAEREKSGSAVKENLSVVEEETMPQKCVSEMADEEKEELASAKKRTVVARLKKSSVFGLEKGSKREAKLAAAVAMETKGTVKEVTDNERNNDEPEAELKLKVETETEKEPGAKTDSKESQSLVSAPSGAPPLAGSGVAIRKGKRSVFGSFLDTKKTSGMMESSAKELAKELSASFRLPFGLTSSTLLRETPAKLDDKQEEKRAEDSQQVEITDDVHPEVPSEAARTLAEDQQQSIEGKDEFISLEDEKSEQEMTEKQEEPSGEGLLSTSDLPLSLAEQQRLSRQKNSNGKKRKAEVGKEGESSVESKKPAAVRPFDFEAAKSKLNLQSVNPAIKGSPQGKRGQGGRGNTVSRLGFEIDEEGLKVGKRSQVYPKSGNRSFVLKK